MRLAAETFVHLVTGATLPDEGDVTMFGQNTRAITDGDAWLKSLDRVGMITARGILIEAFSLLQNIAMSFTLDVDPIDPRIVPQAGALARDVGIEPGGVRSAGREGAARNADARPPGARAGAWPEDSDRRASVGHGAARSRRGVWRGPREGRPVARTRLDCDHRR